MRIGYMSRNLIEKNLEYTITFSSEEFDEKNFRVYCNDENVIQEVRPLYDIFLIDIYCNVHVHFENISGHLLQRNIVATIVI